jgi:hypothetical protein
VCVCAQLAVQILNAAEKYSQPFRILHLSEAPITEIPPTTEALEDVKQTFYARRIAGPNPAGFLDHFLVGGFAEFQYEFRQLPECIGRRSRPAAGTKSQHVAADHTDAESAQQFARVASVYPSEREGKEYNEPVSSPP